MKFERKGLKTYKGYLDMTPLIDVVFLLLIFFMLSSSFILQSGIKVNLPRAVSAKSVDKTNTIITILKDRTIYINDKLTSAGKLSSLLERVPKESIIIKADGEVELDTVITVWDICRKLGIESINIAAKHKTL